MPEQILPAYPTTDRYPWPGLRLMRAFRIAVDLRKLILAAAGLLLMAAGEWLFQSLPFAPRPLPGQSAPSAWELVPRPGIEPSLAAEMLRAPEWSPQTVWRLATRWDVVLSPVRTLADPVTTLLKPNVTWSDAAWGITRLLWALSVWAVFGGAILRMAAVQFARDVKISVRTALRFSLGKFLSLLSAPLLPLSGIGLLCLACGLGGLLGRIPSAGPVIVACAWFLALALSFAMTLLLIGVAAGWPLMWAAISTEGSDAFDGFSRSYSFVFGRPWQYFVYGLTALAYGSIVTVFLTAVFGVMGHLAAWSVGTGMGPTGVADLHSAAPPLVEGVGPVVPPGEVPTLASQIAGGWMFVFSLLLSSFTWSYFWTASVILYFLLRQSDDATRYDEVWLPEEEEKDDLLPLAGVAASDQPVIERPIRRPEERSDAAVSAPARTSGE